MKKFSILVIDNEQGIREMFKFMLEPEGYEVFTAEDGTRGLEMAKTSSYDLIFLDVDMPPGMGGQEVLRKIRQFRPEQLIVIFSSNPNPEDTFEDEAGKKGAFSCIYKPFKINEVMDTINRAKRST